MRYALPSIAVLVVTATLTAGCSPLLGSVAEQTLLDDGRYVIIEGLHVPKVRGVEGCGAQALATVMAFREPEIDVVALAAELPWHDQGATPVDLLLEARGRGYEAVIARGSWEMLVEQIERDVPTVVMFDAALEVRTLTGRLPTVRLMHWGVVSGVNPQSGRLLLAAPKARHHEITRDEFMHRWSKADFCAITVSGPGRAATGPS